MTERFESAEVGSARLVAEMLLAHVIGCERMRLYMEIDRPAAVLIKVPEEPEQLCVRASPCNARPQLVANEPLHRLGRSLDLEVV